MATGEMALAVSRVLAQGYQIDPEAFAVLTELSTKGDIEPILKSIIEKKEWMKADRVIVRSDLNQFVLRDEDETRVIVNPEDLVAEIVVVSDPTETIAPAEAQDGFKRLFQDRYSHLLDIARQRPDSKGVTSIESGREMGERGYKIAGLLSSRNSRKGGGVEIMLDDPTGSAKLYCGDELAGSALALPLDSLVVADVVLGKGGGQLYARELLLPDIPMRKTVGSSRRVYAVMLSDLHIGSKFFLADDFSRFLAWLNGRLGDLDMVERIRYVIVAGDVVDGIGVYPGQEYQLSEKNLRRQYAMAREFLGQVPKHMKLLIVPGNHDPVRQALPQPAVSADVGGPLYELENAVHLGGPANVKLDGVNFLIYHGRSLDDVIATVPDLTYDRPVEAMEILLKARHLAPTYGKRTALSPELRDMLVIDPVPDVFHAGHVHTLDVGIYRGTLIVNSGTFQSQTPFQANMGLDPISSIVPILDLSTLEITKRNFTRLSYGELQQLQQA
jgi:DNA polymerase II small subunit